MPADYEQLVEQETLIFAATEAIAEVRANWPGGMSYGEIARRTGMSKAHLIRFMRGEGNPTLATVAKVAHALNRRAVVSLVPLPASVDSSPAADHVCQSCGRGVGAILCAECQSAGPEETDRG